MDGCFYITVMFKAGFIPKLFASSCMGRRPLIKLFLLLTTNYPNAKTPGQSRVKQNKDYTGTKTR